MPAMQVHPVKSSIYFTTGKDLPNLLAVASTQTIHTVQVVPLPLRLRLHLRKVSRWKKPSGRRRPLSKQRLNIKSMLAQVMDRQTIGLIGSTFADDQVPAQKMRHVTRLIRWTV